MAQAIVKKSSESWGVAWERMKIVESRKDFLVPWVFSGFSSQKFQTNDEEVQPRRAWSRFSASFLQTGQVLEWEIPIAVPNSECFKGRKVAQPLR